MYDIILGRSEKDREKFGTKGAVFLGRQYVKMGQVTSLSNNIFMDVTRSHVVFVCGKRGGGKSYTMGVIAEGVSDLPVEIKENISVVMLDTMGIYWTMKYPNKQDENLLTEWSMKSKSLNITIFTPIGFFKKYKDEGIPTDKPFAVKPSELDPSDWRLTFGLAESDPVSVLIERIILRLKEETPNFGLDEVISAIKSDEKTPQVVKDGAENRFVTAKAWGLFDKDGTELRDLVKGGQVSVLDVSCYATTPGASQLRALVIGLVAQKLFLERMVSRKAEEYAAVHKATHYIISEEENSSDKMPMVWLVIDEAHEFLPNEGKTTSSDALITILREGRQPGISLILATQQPGKIHTDVMTQSDIVIAHRITAKIDTQSLGALMQSYMREGLDKQLDDIPRIVGSALVFDDTNERMFPMKIRPRLTWHGGSAPSAMPEKKKIFSF